MYGPDFNYIERGIFQCIAYTAIRMDLENFGLNDSGIYFSPELQISFEIGKQIYLFRDKVFREYINEGATIEWRREEKIPGNTIFDIMFDIKKNGEFVERFVIELKLRTTIDKCLNDIRKLQALGDENHKFFCVFSDTFDPEQDGWMEQFDKANARRIDVISFPTNQSWYSRQGYCKVQFFGV